MKYMLLVYSDEKVWDDASREACFEESGRLCAELESAGKLLAASPLHFVDMASSVRVRDGKRLVTAGPFAETSEQLGGYYLVDVGDLDEALAIAARIPAARKGTIEVRPVFELDGVPSH